MSKGFTLIELLISLLIISTVISFVIFGGARLFSPLEYNISANQVLADVKLTQQLARTSHQTCRIDFEQGKNIYLIRKGNDVYRTCAAGKGIQFTGKTYFSFASSGCTDVGGSGTLSIGGSPNVKKIVVSSKGRIRIE